MLGKVPLCDDPHEMRLGMSPHGSMFKPGASAGRSFWTQWNWSPRGWPLLGLISGLLMGLAPAPGNAWFLAWVALAPLWIVVLDSLANEAGAPAKPVPFRWALIWGIGYHGLALSWIRGLHPLTWMGIPWLASIAITGFCWLFITLWGAGLVVLWSWLFHRLNTAAGSPLPLALRVISGTAIWCGLEALWGYGALYWTSLSYTQSPHNLLILHLGRWSGPLTVTAAIVACNALLAEAGMRWRRFHQPRSARQLLLLNLILVLLLHLLGWGLYRQPLVNSAALNVGLVQGNVPTRIKLFEEGLRLSLENYTRGYEALVNQGVDAVLTPEGALPWYWLDNPMQNPLYRTILDRGVTAWVGTVGLRQGRITQTLFTISGSGEIVGRYDKVKLVPLGEYIPFESLIGGWINRLSPMGASMLPGSPNQRLDTPFGQAIVGICYESAFPELFRRQAASGGQFILTASNNDPYNAAMMAQHHAQDVMRAIETDRWAVRATNTGLSGIVDPHGNTRWLSGFRTFETHAHQIYRRQTRTLYVHLGNWLTPLLLVITLVGWTAHRLTLRD